MEAALDSFVNKQDWKNAASAAGNLSELHLVLGDLVRAEARAHEAVEHADRSQNNFQQLSKRTALADALHQCSDLAAARALFEDAESSQRTLQPSYPFLYSVRGHLYCDLLLELNDAVAVVRRSTQALAVASTHGWLLDIALEHLNLGRAHLALDELGPAREYFDRAVEASALLEHSTTCRAASSPAPPSAARPAISSWRAGISPRR